MIKEQMLQLNTLVDWNYEYFTMDKVIKKNKTQYFISSFWFN